MLLKKQEKEVLSMKKKALTLEEAEETIRLIAVKNHIPVEKVRSEMIDAMEAGMNNPDPNIQAMWKTIPCRGEKPTPEELIVWAANRV